MVNTNKIELLNSIPAVTLFESPMLWYLQRYIYTKNHNKIASDRFLAFRPLKKNNHTLLTVHVDRLGLVYTGGKITYSNYYGYETYGEKYKPIDIFGSRFVGQKVVAYEPHRGTPIAEGVVKSFTISDSDKMCFKVRGLSRKIRTYPIPITYHSPINVDNRTISGQLDNILGIYVAYYLLKLQTGYTVLFTTEEEIGKSWHYISQFLDKYKYRNLIVLDTSSISGLSDVNETDVVVRTSDDRAVFSRDLVDKILCVTNDHKFRYLLKTKSPKGKKIRNITEIGRLLGQKRHKFRGATVQFPTINYHTNYETVALKSIKAVITTLLDLDKVLK